MPADPQDTDPIDQNPSEREMGRRSSAPSTSPWLLVGVLILIGAGVYVVSAMM